jgi:hypothetical protein
MRPVNATGPKRGRIGLYPAKTGGHAQTAPKRRRLRGNRAAGALLAALWQVPSD